MLTRSNSVGNNDSDSRNRRRNQNRRNSQNNKKSRFKGDCSDIEQHVYESGLPNSNQDLYSTTTQKIYMGALIFYVMTYMP